MSVVAATNSGGPTAEEEPAQLNILAQLKTIEQINEQRRIFLNGTIAEESNGTTELQQQANINSRQAPSSIFTNSAELVA